MRLVFEMNVKFLAPAERVESAALKIRGSYYVKYCYFALMNAAIMANVYI